MNKKKIQSQIDKLEKLKTIPGIPQGDLDDAQAKIEQLKEQLKGSSKKKANDHEASDYAKWEDLVTDGVASIMETTRGEAQGIIEAKNFEMKQAWGKGLSPTPAAKFIVGKMDDGKSAKSKKKKSAKKKSAKKNGEKKYTDSDLDKKLKECKDTLKANSKPRKEPVNHTRETRFINALKTISNILIEGNEDDPAMITKIENTVTRFEIKCKEDFIGLKRVKHSEELKEKFDKAGEKAEE